MLFKYVCWWLDTVKHPQERCRPSQVRNQSSSCSRVAYLPQGLERELYGIPEKNKIFQNKRLLKSQLFIPFPSVFHYILYKGLPVGINRKIQIIKNEEKGLGSQTRKRWELAHLGKVRSHCRACVYFSSWGRGPYHKRNSTVSFHAFLLQ